MGYLSNKSLCKMNRICMYAMFSRIEDAVLDKNEEKAKHFTLFQENSIALQWFQN